MLFPYVCELDVSNLDFDVGLWQNDLCFVTLI